jgi:outer membrane protein TolC
VLAGCAVLFRFLSAAANPLELSAAEKATIGAPAAVAASSSDAPLEVSPPATQAPPHATGTGKNKIDVNSPLIDPYVKLPIDIRDATSASHLMQHTQAIIDATIIIVPAGSRPLQLVDVVKETLQKNLALNAARLDPRIAALQVDSAWSQFDPTGFAQVSISTTNTPSAGFLSGDFGGGATIKKVQERFWGLGTSTKGSPIPQQGFTEQSQPGQPSVSYPPALGVTRKLVTGTRATMLIRYDRQDGNIPIIHPLDQEYRTQGTFFLIHPLMRGSGCEVNLATVRIAYNNSRISEQTLRQISLSTLAAAHKAYWELVFARVDLAIKQQSLGLAADLLRENRIRYKYGDLIAVDVYEAEAGVKSRERDVIEAENNLDRAMDDIRELVALDRKRPDWLMPLTPIDPPVFMPIQIDEAVSQEVALAQNPDILSAKIQIANSHENQLLAADRFRPNLDLGLGVAESGLGETWGKDHKSLTTGEFTSWDARLSYARPLYRRKEKADLLASSYQISQANLNLKNTEQSVLYNHRTVVRNIQNLERYVEAAKASVRANQDRLEKQKISHEQGVTTSHDLLQVQEAYAQAQAAEVRSIVNYYLSFIELERVRGTLLDSLGFEFIPMAASK